MSSLTNSIGHVEKVFETTNRRDIYNEALTKVLSTQIEVYKNGFVYLFLILLVLLSSLLLLLLLLKFTCLFSTISLLAKTVQW